MIWQMDVTHYAPFGKFKYVHISIDTYSGALHASALTGESAKNIQAHWLEASSHLGRPQQIKTDNGPGYLAHSTQVFLQRWNIQHKTGISYNLTGQAILERSHHTFKNLLKKKGGSHESSPQNLIMLAMFTYNFVNRDESLCTPVEKHFQKKEPKSSHPPVSYRDPLGDGSWQGPIELLT